MMNNTMYNLQELDTFPRAQLEGAKGAKAAFQILAKCCVFSLLLSQYSNEKRNFETPFELLIL